MIELRDDSLVFNFSEVHPQARLTISFQRTLRIPDDGETYPLPPGLGNFPLRHVDDFAERVPPAWIERGGILFPMYQAEALWLNFDAAYVPDRETSYPCAIKVAAGKIDAVTGKQWTNGLHRRPQDYMVSPKQPWLDGYCVQKGLIRQFVAMPLGEGYTAEEQITGEAEHGGLQIAVYPMKRDVFERRFPIKPRMVEEEMEECYDFCCVDGPDMGLAPGGRMKQEIYADPFDLADWDLDHGRRCFVHLTNSVMWYAITGEKPPTPPVTASDYEEAGLPWFDYYDGDAKALKGGPILKWLRSVRELGQLRSKQPLPENDSVAPGKVINLRAGLKKGQVREGKF